MVLNLKYVVLILLVPLTLACSGVSPSSDTLRMTKDMLTSKMEGDGEGNLIVLDVRFESQWKNSEYKIKGAVHEDPAGFKSWADKYPKDKILVLYCA